MITTKLILSALIAAFASASRLPDFTRGIYLLVADSGVSVKNDKGKEVPSTGNWNPKFSSWIHQFNVVFFSFIDSDMQVPQSFENARLSGQF
jgi:hypothetical protein